MGIVTFRRTAKIKPKRNTLFYLREFINFPQENTHAYVLAECAQAEKGDTPWLTLELADCAETVSFELGVGSPRALENTLYKLEVLRTAVMGLERALWKSLPLIKKKHEEAVVRNRQRLAELEAQEKAGTLKRDDRWELNQLRRSVDGDDD